MFYNFFQVHDFFTAVVTPLTMKRIKFKIGISRPMPRLLVSIIDSKAFKIFLQTSLYNGFEKINIFLILSIQKLTVISKIVIRTQLKITFYTDDKISGRILHVFFLEKIYNQGTVDIKKKGYLGAVYVHSNQPIECLLIRVVFIMSLRVIPK